MSNFAFGTYRISDLNPQHVEALREAIESGVDLIDTSSNYMDGGAQRAIAAAMRAVESDKKNEVEIVSKFGYIQGSSLLEYRENFADKKYSKDVVKYSEDCYHCISKEFLHVELTESLKRLEVSSIGCYLIHNPEYYILDAINKNISKDDRLDEMYRRIENAFIGLEEEIRDSRILSYGISSNSFSLLGSDDEFLPYEDLLTLAQNAATIVGNQKHSFTTIQLPINILETEGLKCAAWAKQNGLRVLANRPLNAKYKNRMYRLADYKESREYYHYFNELIEFCDRDELRALYNLLEEMEATKHKFDWIGSYDIFLFTQIIPHIKKSLERFESEEVEDIINTIRLYLVEYRKMVEYECSVRTRDELKQFFKESHLLMQEIAIKFLMKCENVDYVIVGMRKPLYVYEILSLRV
ncbi:oxidoreductase-like protein protein [Sulfurimonas denitrificans DSM 1251]|uniref:Oxidoreductase-like protein protein n=1 Tax=Sulfurimonas denitrificans (strain ATCC 33889 / DSM 1251) TaxID=326298 RepID=Q30TS1_SULDN|nr:aldo/keto reductase [Sulfurimonas denitrificans]ABB43610.1 oxidoreductase-like protein protein [Sulfurimonas denitrificans DSM 1251]MDD3442499.1 aldo/keto reductase [Sulfurimonas denitrificans]